MASDVISGLKYNDMLLYHIVSFPWKLCVLSYEVRLSSSLAESVDVCNFIQVYTSSYCFIFLNAICAAITDMYRRIEST